MTALYGWLMRGLTFGVRPLVVCPQDASAGYINVIYTMHYYQAFGLTIASELALPELVPATCDESQVQVQRGSVSGAFANTRAEQESPYYQAGPDRVVLHWPEVGAFEVEKGRRIVVDLKENIELSLARLPLLGAVFAALLLQRRRLVLHASAVAVHGRAVGFVGMKGAGKSTMSAALYGLGHSLVSDDLLAVRLESEAVWVDPSFPRFKLWPEAAEAALRDDPDQLPPLHDRIRKRARMANGSFSTPPQSLGAVYVLALGSDVETRPISGREALFELLPHNYNDTLINAIGDASIRRWHFEACSELVKRVPVRLLQRPADLDRLQETAERVASEM